MHKSTAKAEFYFFGSALAAIFSDDLHITSFSSSAVSSQTACSLDKRFRFQLAFHGKPAQNRGQEGITEERYKQFLILYLKEILYKKRHDRLEHLVKVILKTVLPFDPQGTLVKCFILIENIADRHQHIPFILKVLSAHVCQKVHIKDPVYQIVFIFKMIIKAFPVQTAFLAEI